MTDADRRVATLAALFAPARSTALLARLADDAAGVAALAAGLAAAPRPERLRALAAALAVDGATVRARADEVATRERPSVAKLVRAVADGRACGDVSPAAIRLCRERIGR